jgi:alcohol dehydrogenase (cytochrome c)
MKQWKMGRRIAGFVLGGLGLVAAGAAQAQSDAALLHPTPDSWPLYHGEYNGQRHTKIPQITPANVGNLGLAWAFQTNNAAGLKASPLVVNNVLYITVPDNIWAMDPMTGHLLWHYTYPSNKGLHIGHRGVGAYNGHIYFVSPDDHLVSLDAKTGKVNWSVEIADVAKGYWTTLSPLAIKGHIIVGTSGDFDNLHGFLKSFDSETGKLQWQYNTTPADRTGGNTWMTGTYDPDLNLIYWGTGNPTPVLNGSTRPGDDPGTCAIIAVNPDTGKLAWEFQVSPHDTHDWDAAESPILVDGPFKGQQRKMLMQASRNGLFVVLDRTNGKNLLNVPYAATNWFTGFDKDGRAIPNKDKEPTPDGRLIAPDETGAGNYRSASFDPKTGLFIASARDAYSIYFSKPADGNYGWSGADYGLWAKGYIRAIDYQTGKVRWQHPIGNGASAGVLTTDSGVTFSGDDSGNAIALRTSDGKTLWHSQTGSGISTSPMTYEVGGKQYVLYGSGSVLFAYALPDVEKK